MDSDQAHRLFLRFRPTVAYVATEDDASNVGIGSAFHVGDGVFLTARHVVENRRITEIGLSHALLDKADGLGGGPYDAEMEELLKWHCGAKVIPLKDGPFFHAGANVDVACFVCDGLHADTPAVPLGSHLDDWIGNKDFVLSEAVVMGYPPIPLTREPYLISARAEVNAVIDIPTVPHIHFVLSAIPRGGFSGGLVFSEYGFLIGMVTQSLLNDGAPEQLGFFTAISVEPMYICLADNRVLPECQAEDWDGFWTDPEYGYRPLR